MSNTPNRLPEGWKWEKLGDCADFINGQAFKPSDWKEEGFPIIRIQNLNDPSKPYNYSEGGSASVFVQDGDILFSWSASLGIFIWDGGSALLNQHIFKVVPHSDIDKGYFYYVLSHSLDKLKNRVHGSTMRHLTKSSYESLEVPVPPLPVQERIVLILQKADEIRRKRQEAVATLTKLSSSTFEDFFSSFHQDGNGIIRTVADVLREEPANGKSPSKKKELCTAEVLTLTAVRNGRLNIDERRLASFDVANVSRFYIKTGDAFVVRGNGNINLLARIGFYDGEDVEIVYPDTLIRVRFNNEIVLNEFIQYLWDTPLIRNQIISKAKTTSGTHKINQDDLKSIEFPCPPLELQQKFLMTAQTYFSYSEKLNNAEAESQAIFHSLLAQAFTGELTAEWEAANAAFIVAKQQYHQRLPRLITLAFLREKHRRTQAQTHTTLLTALMKYLFLFQIESTSQRKLYQFVPYHYGPFAKDLYTDLETLQQDNAITVDNTDEDKTRITLTNLNVIDTALDELTAEIPPEQADLIREEFANLQDDVATILDTYGELDHNALLTTVYEKYPAYAKNSKVKQRQKRAKKSSDEAEQLSLSD